MKSVAKTPRLLLREFEVEDAPFILELLNTEKWLRMIGDRNVRTLPDAKVYIERKLIQAYKEYGFGFWLVFLPEESKAIGMCGLVKRVGLEDVDIGFAFLPAYEGRGYGFEAASATINLAKDYHLPRLAAITTSYNFASIALLTRLQFDFAKTIRLAGDEEELMFFLRELNNE